jgi:S1-C subfamily serine protease
MKFLSREFIKILSVCFFALVLVVIVVFQYQKSEKTNNLRIQEVLDDQAEALEAAQDKISKLLEEDEKAGIERGYLENQLYEQDNSTESNNLEITIADLNTYISGVARVGCGNSSGTGFFMNLNSGYVVVTNDHVVESAAGCFVSSIDLDGFLSGLYQLDLKNQHEWNKHTDVTILGMEIAEDFLDSDWVQPLSSLNYKLTELRTCPVRLPEGSPVVVIGYPAFGMTTVELHGDVSTVSSRQVTQGIISGYDASNKFPYSKLRYDDYYVSAKIDSGNSGGPALSKDGEGLCLLGMATWLSIGNYETQGVIQNMHNVLSSFN